MINVSVLVGVLAVLVGVLGFFCIVMVYLLHEMEHSELWMVYLAFSLKTRAAKNVRNTP